VFLPVGIIQGLFSPISGWFSDKVNAKIPIMTGMGLLVLSFYINSNLSFLTEHSYIMTSLYLRGLGMGLVFTPLSTLSLITIPREKMAQASGIMNTVRQIGGSMGVALLSTILTARVNFHGQMFGGSIQAGSQEFQAVTKRLAFFIQQHGGGASATALKQAQSIVMSNVSTQAFIQGINDDFLIAAIISLIGFIPIIMLKSKKKTLKSLSTEEHVPIVD